MIYLKALGFTLMILAGVFLFIGAFALGIYISAVLPTWAVFTIIGVLAAIGIFIIVLEKIR